jgi:hypothetical protein
MACADNVKKRITRVYGWNGKIRIP